MKQYPITLTSNQLNELAYLAEKEAENCEGNERAFYKRLAKKLDSVDTSEEFVKNLTKAMQDYKPQDMLERAENGTSGLTLDELASEQL